MAHFDSVVWKSRAWDRFSRALQRGDKKSNAENQWIVDYLSIKDLDAVVNWAAEHGLTVEFMGKGGGVYDHTNKNIVISSRLSPLRQLAFLLHEAGHHLINRSDASERYAMGYMAEGPHVKKTLSHRMAVLDEEMEAWHRGWKLAGRLDLSIEWWQYEAVKLECLKTYVKWVARKGDWEGYK